MVPEPQDMVPEPDGDEGDGQGLPAAAGGTKPPFRGKQRGAAAGKRPQQGARS